MHARILGESTNHVGGNFEHGIAPVALGDLHNHPAGSDDLRRFRANPRDDARRVSLQRGEAENIL